MLNKVPEVVIWFWIIKVLCTTVGESFADWINQTLGVGLVNTSLIFTGGLAVVLVVQMRLPRYVPIAYWLTVVVLSVTGTLYTDILTDQLKVPLALSTSVFAVILAVVFGIWYSRERTLSIHSIVTTPREAFYWLAVLVTFALGTASGDWILDLTGWPPGKSVLLPAGLIVAVVIGWRLGANPSCRSGSRTSSPDRSAPTSATTSPCRRPTAGSAWAPPRRASCSSLRSWQPSCT